MIPNTSLFVIERRVCWVRRAPTATEPTKACKSNRTEWMQLRLHTDYFQVTSKFQPLASYSFTERHKTIQSEKATDKPQSGAKFANNVFMWRPVHELGVVRWFCYIRQSKSIHPAIRVTTWEFRVDKNLHKVTAEEGTSLTDTGGGLNKRRLNKGSPY